MEGSDLDWIAAGAPAVHRGLTAPDGGVEHPAVIIVVRGIIAGLHERGCRGAWLMVDGSEAVGMCSYRRPPQGGEVEIGYGVAASRRNRGYASQAVALMAEIARTSGVRRLTAETAIHNVSSSRVLEKNGFVAIGRRIDIEDGEVCAWLKEI